jgi:hypothetical protein
MTSYACLFRRYRQGRHADLGAKRVRLEQARRAPRETYEGTLYWLGVVPLMGGLFASDVMGMEAWNKRVKRRWCVIRWERQ